MNSVHNNYLTSNVKDKDVTRPLSTLWNKYIYIYLSIYIYMYVCMYVFITAAQDTKNNYLIFEYQEADACEKLNTDPVKIWTMYWKASHILITKTTGKYVPASSHWKWKQQRGQIPVLLCHESIVSCRGGTHSPRCRNNIEYQDILILIKFLFMLVC